MICPSCAAENTIAMRECFKCGCSLQLVRANHFLELAEVQINQGGYEQASESLVQADRAILMLDTNEREQHLFAARAFWLQSSIYYNKGDMDGAREELLDACRLLVKRDHGTILLAEILNRLGNISHYAGNINEAVGYFVRSSDLAVKVKAFATATKAINNLGNAYISLGDIGKAVECYSSGLAYAEQAGPVALSQAYTILAWLYSNYGPFSLALEYATKASDLCKQIENLDNRAMVIAQIGATYLKHGDLEQAEQYLSEGYRTAQRTANKIVEEQILAQLCELVQQKNDNEAWQSYAMKTFRASASSPYLRKESALQLISYYIKQGDMGRAERVLLGMRDAYRQAGGTGKRDKAIINHAEALFHAAIHKWTEASEHFRIALDNSSMTTYEYACIWEEFGDMLLRQASIEHSFDKANQGREALEKAASFFNGIELPHRAAVIASKIKDSATITYTSSAQTIDAAIT